MSIQINWNKIRNEVTRLSDVNVLKSEVQKISDDVRNFDYQKILSPNAKKKVKEFEKKYTKVMKSVQSAQRQVDREFNKIVRQVQEKRQTAEQQIEKLRGLAETQKQKIDSFIKAKTAKAKTKGSSKSTSKKKTAAKKTGTSKTKKA